MIFLRLNNITGNILKVIKYLSADFSDNILNIEDGPNRINDVGERLEIYIKHLFANIKNTDGNDQKLLKIDNVFSYTGQKNSPPDLILKKSDAIEIKKISKIGSKLQLNSSFPYNKLYSDNHRLTKKCKKCEGIPRWTQKDIIYTIGHVSNKKLKYLWMVYGDCFAAKKAIYENLKNSIVNKIDSIAHENHRKNEIANYHGVDPRHKTNLRVREIWDFPNFKNVFSYLIWKAIKESSFTLVTIMKLEKYNDFPIEDRRTMECNEKVLISDVKVDDPDEIELTIEAKLIIFAV